MYPLLNTCHHLTESSALNALDLSQILLVQDKSVIQSTNMTYMRIANIVIRMHKIVNSM